MSLDAEQLYRMLPAIFRVRDRRDEFKGLLSVLAGQARAFGQPVTDAEIMRMLHDVEGVKAVRVTKLQRSEQPLPSPAGVLPAHPARWHAGKKAVLPAELLLLHPTGLTLVIP